MFVGKVQRRLVADAGQPQTFRNPCHGWNPYIGGVANNSVNSARLRRPQRRFAVRDVDHLEIVSQRESWPLVVNISDENPVAERLSQLDGRNLPLPGA